MRIVALFAVFAVTGCAATQEIADNVARDRAKVTINAVVEKNLPGLNAAPVTDCVVDAASAQEILQIAGASVTGVQPDTVDLVLNIAKRPDAVSCIAKAALQLG